MIGIDDPSIAGDVSWKLRSVKGSTGIVVRFESDGDTVGWISSQAI